MNIVLRRLSRQNTHIHTQTRFMVRRLCFEITYLDLVIRQSQSVIKCIIKAEQNPPTNTMEWSIAINNLRSARLLKLWKLIFRWRIDEPKSFELNTHHIPDEKHIQEIIFQLRCDENFFDDDDQFWTSKFEVRTAFVHDSYTYWSLSRCHFQICSKILNI